MQVDSLNCNHCGAPLSVPATTNYATCKHCGAKLVVRRTDSATYTELTEAIAKPLDQMADSLGKIAHEQELERIDREWEMERAQYLVEDNKGSREIPRRGTAFLGGLMVAGFGLLWTVMAFSITSGPGFGAYGNDFGPAGNIGNCFPLFGILFIAAGVLAAIMSYQKAGAYEQAQQRYQQRRAAAGRAKKIES